jgi:hypothetical protein
MVPNPTLIEFITPILEVSTFIFIMLLPALLELKRPKDAGPRVIMDNAPPSQSQIRKGTFLILDLEQEQRCDQAIIKKIADVIAILPSMET